jgi:transposase
VVNGVDGYQYLKALLAELPRAKTVEDFETLLPWRIATLKHRSAAWCKGVVY